MTKPKKPVTLSDLEPAVAPVVKPPVVAPAPVMWDKRDQEVIAFARKVKAEARPELAAMADELLRKLGAG